MNNTSAVDVPGLFPELKLFQVANFVGPVIRAWELAIARGNFSQPDECHFLPREVGFTTQIGLVTHTRIVTELSLKMADIIARNLPVGREFVLAGALLHDVGKLLEYGPSGAETVITLGGRRLNHRFSGAALCQEAGLPPEVVHIVFAHSREGQFVERSVEAVIVSHADFTHFEAVKARVSC
jgi:putative nucleotidyltransferase with HDIG domain